MEVGCVSGLELHDSEILNAWESLAEEGQKVVVMCLAKSAVCRPVIVISQAELTDELRGGIGGRMAQTCF